MTKLSLSHRGRAAYVTIMALNSGIMFGEDTVGKWVDVFLENFSHKPGYTKMTRIILASMANYGLILLYSLIISNMSLFGNLK